MKTGLLIVPLVSSGIGPIKITYNLHPTQECSGISRAIQLLNVIILTTKGSDSLHPNFGTHLSSLPVMSVGIGNEATLFVRDELNDAIQQFFDLQRADTKLTDEDLISSISVNSISTDASNRVTAKLHIKPKLTYAVIASIAL